MQNSNYYMYGNSHCWHCGLVYADEQLKGILQSECPRCGCLTARFTPVTDDLESIMGPCNEMD